MYNKGNHKQNEKTTYRMGKNIGKRCDLQGLNFQNIQIAHTTQQQKTTQSKNGQKNFAHCKLGSLFLSNVK